MCVLFVPHCFLFILFKYGCNHWLLKRRLANEKKTDGVPLKNIDGSVIKKDNLDKLVSYAGMAVSCVDN